MEAGTIDMTAWLGFNGIPKMGVRAAPNQAGARPLVETCNAARQCHLPGRRPARMDP